MRFRALGAALLLSTTAAGVGIAYAATVHQVTTSVHITVLPLDPTNLVATAISVDQVALAWTDQSINEDGFRIERKTGSAPFTQIATSSPNLVTYTDTTVAPNTTYIYRVIAFNSNGDSNPTNELSVNTPAPSGAGGGSSGGGGGGGIVFGSSSFSLSGRAAPGAAVTILRDAGAMEVVRAGADGSFYFTARDITPGRYALLIFMTDRNGMRSAPASIALDVAAGAMTAVSGIVLPPTLTTDMAAVRRGGTVLASGYTLPGAMLSLSVSGSSLMRKSTVADGDGRYAVSFGTDGWADGWYRLSAVAAWQAITTGRSYERILTVGEVTLPRPFGTCPERGDLNGNCRVNLADFSILVYWDSRPSFPREIDLSEDGVLDLADFSIMVYHWTG